MTATRAGRRVEIATRRGLVEVSEVTRSGTPVRTARFMSSRVIALVEHPAARAPTADEQRGPCAPLRPAGLIAARIPGQLQLTPTGHICHALALACHA